uniref:ARAD1A14916p n=1 Tax=Blastobotrys adeninivorans TaxID=409370 RepID=A0A060SYX8_BLAAD
MTVESSAKINTDVIVLSDGSKMPAIGFGTSWNEDSLEDGYKATKAALEAGYRHIDTAFQYNNEEVVGRAIRESGIPREQLFIVTKLTSVDHRDPAAALDKSLKNLGLDYVDLYLMHWPLSWKEEEVVDEGWNHVKTWELMQKLPKDKARSLGVSNYDVQRFDELFSSPTTTMVPTVNQVEIHPYLAQERLVKYCKEKNIVLEAYSPLCNGKLNVNEEPIIVERAKKYNVTPQQLLLSWGLKRGYAVLPKSVTPERVIANLKTTEISDEDEEAIRQLSKIRPTRIVNHAWATKTLFTDDTYGL